MFEWEHCTDIRVSCNNNNSLIFCYSYICVCLCCVSRGACRPPDSKYPLGYGKAMYFYSLLAASSLFFIGCGATIVHSLQTMFSPLHSVDVGWVTWLVLGGSFVADGTVLVLTLQGLWKSKPPGAVCWALFVLSSFPFPPLPS